MRISKVWTTVIAFAAIGSMSMAVARADEAQAKSLVKAMSDYLAAQKPAAAEDRVGQFWRIGSQSSGQASRNAHGRICQCRNGL